VVERGRLVGRVQGENEPMALVPVSPTRLRLLGDVGTYLDVEMSDGTGFEVALERAGTRVPTWKRANSK